MMNETKIFDRKKLRLWRWVDVQVWKWENSSLLPALNFRLDLWRPEQVRLIRGGKSLILHGHVHIWTAAIVLGAVSAIQLVRYLSPKKSCFGLLGCSRVSSGKGLPLREVLVTTDVPALASVTAFARLGMAIKHQ